MKKALITGITGQDGSYLAELLLKKNYIVYGIIRPSSIFRIDRIDHLYSNPKIREKKLKLVYGDLADSSSINKVITQNKFDEIYNLGAQSHVLRSFQIPEYTANINSLGTLRILDAIKNNKYDTKLYQATTSECFGNSNAKIQNEKTPFNPCSPYGIAKLYAYYTTKNYLDSFGIFSSNGILFNHESPRRGESFVTRKITTSIARIYNKNQDKIKLGNLSAKRDWGYAKEYVEAMWLMLQQNKPDDFVISTGESYSVRDFCTEAFKYVDINIEWIGRGISEKGINKKNGKVLVEVDPKYFRPSELNTLKGDYKKARKILKWSPKVKFKKLVHIMMKSDLNIT
jgi:GDPmannose 4,6-dehydratase